MTIFGLFSMLRGGIAEHNDVLAEVRLEVPSGRGGFPILVMKIRRTSSSFHP